MTAIVIAVLAVTLDHLPKDHRPGPAAPVTPSSTTFGTRIGEPITGSTNGLYTVAVGRLNGTPIAVTNGDAVRVWDLVAHRQLGEPITGHADGAGGAAVGS